MSNWISSKLKVAESLLQQIDQQAAESLRKNEKSQSDDIGHDIKRKPAEVLPLKDQLKKKSPNSHDFVSNLRSDDTVYQSKEAGGLVKSKPKSSLTDSDWTELLSGPSKNTNGSNRKMQGRSGSNLSVSERRKNLKALNKVPKRVVKSNVSLGSNGAAGYLDEKQSDGVDVVLSDSTRSSVESQDVDKTSDRRELNNADASEALFKGLVESSGDKEQVLLRDAVVEGALHLKDENRSPLLMSTMLDEINGLKLGTTDDHNRFLSSVVQMNEGSTSSKSIRSSRRGSSSTSGTGSDSETGSDSSDSESEREREERRRRRMQMLAEKAAAKAIEAIKERENLVARLEGEKQSLEKILDERARQQAQEASKLQMAMMETMDAVDVEKQKHNATRMEALARLAKLETANADLAKSLATAQWNLEVEANRVAELRQQIELKESSHEELRWKIVSHHQAGKNLKNSKGVEFERDILEAEYSFLTDKVERLRDKIKTLETCIEMTQKEMESPTEVEGELKRRLGQLTDHLIQKQAQVESLSSEKATLLFRIEAVSRLLDENKSLLMADNTTGDLESGIWELSSFRLKPLFQDKLRSGQKHLGSFIRQLDTVFNVGAVFLRRNRIARIWSLVYITCLHFWVLYILLSHHRVSDEGSSIGVVSLENINNTGGI